MDAELSIKRTSAETWIAASEWVLILSALALFTVTETYQPYVTAGLGLLAIFFAERGVRGKLISLRTGLELPMLLFILSAGGAVWYAYDQAQALLQFARLLTAAAIFFALHEDRPPFPQIVAAGFLGAAAALALYWPVKNDFSRFPERMGSINSVGLWLNERFAAPPGPDIQSNVAAGVLLVSIPVGAALSWQAWKKQNYLAGVLTALLTLIVLVGLLMTGSRGAWIGLSGMVGVAGLAVVQRHWFRSNQAKKIFWLVLLFAGLLAAYLILISGSLEKWAGQIPDASGSLHSRVDLWREGLELADDYAFTGSGLQTYWMVHAAYGLLIQVPFIAHSHNSFLQIWIEQGVLGVLALIWGAVVIIGWAWNALDLTHIPPLGWAGLAAILAASLHGMVDVVFYIERTLPIVGLLLGFAALTALSQPKASTRQVNKTLLAGITALALVCLLILIATLWRPLAAAWYANVGALKQSQIELSRYDPNHFDRLSLDQIRQTTDLNPVQSDLEKALSFKTANLTALQRLSEIGLARGEYAPALEWMETAWQAGHRDPRTRLLYADALIANGQIEKAVEIIRAIDWADSRLLYLAWYRYYTNQEYAPAANTWKAVLLMDPANPVAIENLANVQKYLNP